MYTFRLNTRSNTMRMLYQKFPDIITHTETSRLLQVTTKCYKLLVLASSDLAKGSIIRIFLHQIHIVPFKLKLSGHMKLAQRCSFIQPLAIF